MLSDVLVEGRTSCRLRAVYSEYRVTRLLATVGNRNRAAGLAAMEKPNLNWIVVRGPIDVDRAHASEGDALVCQQLLSVQLALQGK